MLLTGEKQRRTATDSAPQTGPPSEEESVKARAACRLQRSPYRQVRGVRCEFREGVLSLWGSVRSFYLKQLAQATVLGVEGIEEIDNRVEVIVPPRRP